MGDSDVSFFIENCRLWLTCKVPQYAVVQISMSKTPGRFPSLPIRRFVPGLSLEPDAVFYKRSHSALVGSGLDVWLIRNGIRRVIVCGSAPNSAARQRRDMRRLWLQRGYVTNAT